jgi:hypothetical protein
MNDHADLELIAAFREGLLDPAAGHRIGRHLSGCATCARRQAALDEVTTRLADTPLPPLPPALAQRLDAVLAAEMAAGDAEAAMGSDLSRTVSGSGEPRHPLARHGRRVARERARGDQAVNGPGREYSGQGRSGRGAAARERSGRDRSGHGMLTIALRPLAAAASVCLLAGGGYLLVRSVTQNSPVATSSAPAAGKQQNKSGAALSPRLQMSGRPVAPAQAFAVVHSKTAYRPGRLRAQALSVAQRQGWVLSGGKVGEMPMEGLGGSPSLQGCMRQVTHGQQPLLVDVASYQGRPAMIIIATESGGAVGRVWVVKLGCSSTNGEVIATSGP